MNIDQLSPEQLRRGAEIQEQIRKLQEEYHRVMGGAEVKKTRKPLSEAARKRISKKIKAVWAERKKPQQKG